MHKYKFFFRVSKIIFLFYNFIINLFCIFINKQSSDIFKITNYHVFTKFSKKVIETHNLKFNADNHKGKIQNIVWDPITNVEHFTSNVISFF